MNRTAEVARERSRDWRRNGDEMPTPEMADLCVQIADCHQRIAALVESLDVERERLAAKRGE